MMEIWDFSKNPAPTVLIKDLVRPDVVVVDNNTTRPSFVLPGGTEPRRLVLGALYRVPGINQVQDSDPGLGKWHDGAFLPKLAISTSHHDYARAAVVGFGSVSIDIKAMICVLGVLSLAREDGTYGFKSDIQIGSIGNFRGGVWASGQKDLNVRIEYANAALWSDIPDGNRGHAFYGNESRINATNEFLRLKNVKVSIGKSEGAAVSSLVRNDNVTAKFKGSWGVDYACLNDQNPCGAFDEYGASGVADIDWKHPGGVGAQNGNFTAFRLGGDGGFGTPNGKLCMHGTFDASLAPDQSVPVYRWETKYAAASEVVCVKGGAPSVYGTADATGVVLR